LRFRALLPLKQGKISFGALHPGAHVQCSKYRNRLIGNVLTPRAIGRIIVGDPKSRINAPSLARSSASA